MAAPDLTQRECCFVQKQGTDDLTANAVGAPFSRLTIAAALLDLATNYPVASATNPHIVAIGPGTFDTPAFAWPAFTSFNGSCDGEGRPTTIIRMSGDITIGSSWSANTTQLAAMANLTIRALSGTPALDFTMPVPVAGNPSRRIELDNVTHNLTHEIFEATSTGDVFKTIGVIQDGANTDTLVITSGMSLMSGRLSAAAITIKDKTSFAAAGTWHGVSTGAGSGITVSSVAAAGCSLRLLESSARALVINQTAPGAVLVTADSCSIPVRSAVSFTGTATIAANLVYFNDAAGEGYTPTTPGDWAVPVPINVQQALDALRTSEPGEGLDMTYTGTPITPIVIGGVLPAALLPVVSNPGRLTYLPVAGFSVSFVNITEGGLTSPFAGITSMTWHNLVQGGLIAFGFADNMASCTSISFPVLQYCWGSFSATTMPALTTLSAPSLIGVNGNVAPATCAVLTTFSLPSLVWVRSAYSPATMALLTTLSAASLATVGGSVNINTMASLTSLSFPALASVGGSFTPGTMAALTTWNFPVLAKIGNNFAPTTLGALTSLTMPALTNIGATVTGGNFAPTTMALLTTLTAANLTTINGTFAPTTMAALTTLSFPALATISGAVSAAAMASLTTISLPAMITYGSTITFNSGLGALTSVTLGTGGTLKTITGATINISGQALTSASVNAILALLVTLDGTGGTTLWGAGKTLNTSGGTSGAPSGQGIVDKVTLQVRGATITTN